jgi:hypothetical protein
MPAESGGNVSIVAMEMTQDHQTLNTYYDGFAGGWNWEADLEMRLQQLKTTRSVLSLSICSTRTLRNSSGADRQVTLCRTSPVRTLRLSTRACRTCSIIFLLARRNKHVQNDGKPRTIVHVRGGISTCGTAAPAVLKSNDAV